MDFLSFILGLWAGATIATLAIMFVRGGRGATPAPEDETASEPAKAASPVVGN